MDEPDGLYRSSFSGICIRISLRLLLGLQNLFLIFHETLIGQYVTYQEIVSELLRILLVGPLAFHVAAFLSACRPGVIANYG